MIRQWRPWLVALAIAVIAGGVVVAASSEPTRIEVTPGGEPVTSTSSGSEVTTTTSEMSPAPVPELVPGCRVQGQSSGPLLDFRAPDSIADVTSADAVAPVGAAAKPIDWSAAQQVLDWDGDTEPDRIVLGINEAATGIAPGTATIDAVSDFTITNIKTWDPYVAVQPRVAALSDVTGDGIADLIVVRSNVVAVVAGGNVQSLPSVIDFKGLDEVSAAWVSPPAMVPGAVTADGRQQFGAVPFGSLSVVPLWDITGDGINDFAVVGMASRSAVAVIRGTWYYAGKPCSE